MHFLQIHVTSNNDSNITYIAIFQELSIYQSYNCARSLNRDQCTVAYFKVSNDFPLIFEISGACQTFS